MHRLRVFSENPAALALVAGLLFLAFGWPMASAWRPERPDGVAIHLFTVWMVVIGLLIALARSSGRPSRQTSSSREEKEVG